MVKFLFFTKQNVSFKEESNPFRLFNFRDIHWYRSGYWFRYRSKYRSTVGRDITITEKGRIDIFNNCKTEELYRNEVWVFPEAVESEGKVVSQYPEVEGQGEGDIL